jgi:hypothetical protein
VEGGADLLSADSGSLTSGEDVVPEIIAAGVLAEKEAYIVGF